MNEYRVFNGYTVVTMVEKRDHAAALAAKDAELAEANAEVERLKKDNSGLHEIQDLQRGIITSLRAELDTARAEAQRNADTAEALAGMERLGYKYGLYKADNSWVCAVTLLSDGPKYFHGPTPIAAVRAAEQAKGEFNV